MPQDDETSPHRGCSWGAIGSFAAIGGVLAKLFAIWPGYNEDTVNRLVVIGLFTLNAFLWCGILFSRVNEGYPWNTFRLENRVGSKH